MKNLILSGGGINGLMQLGSLKALDKEKLLNNIENYGGSSVGAAIVFLLCLNFSYDDIYFIFKKMKTSILVEEDFLNFLYNFSIFNLSKFKIFLETLLKLKTNLKKITYLELYNITKKTLHIVAININTTEETMFNYINTPNVNVIDTIIASCSIPFIFPPTKINNDYYIDCIIFNGYPLNIFIDDLDNTIGIYINNKIYKNVSNIDSLQNYIYNLCICTNNMLCRYKKKLIPKLEIEIEIHNSCIEFDLSVEQINELFNKGYNDSIKIINMFRKLHVFKILKKNKKNRIYKLWNILFYKLL